MATAARCRKEQYCRDLWDSLALWDVAEGDVAEVEVTAQGKGKKCQECIRIVKKVKEMAGDDPDDAAVGEALDKVCRARRKGRSRTCKGLVKRYRDQISSSLQNGDEPQDTCAAIGFC
ncbi:granulysin [Pelecanus crispus]|uniref:granulysin n=1 Tax=Pelecanus crispus TaxID=36300 RepID=UPI003F5D100F